jgi:DNA-binding LacI/PurR family transcriptional regulator
MESHDRIRLAAAAQVHPDTIARFLRGEPVRGLSRIRIEAAMKQLGLEPRRFRRSPRREQQPA